MGHYRNTRAVHILSLLREQYGSSGYQGDSAHPVLKGAALGVGGVAAAGLGAGAYAIHKAGGSITNPEHIGAMYHISRGIATLGPAYVGKALHDRGAIEGTKHLLSIGKKIADAVSGGGGGT